MINHRKLGTVILILAILAGISGGIAAIFSQLSGIIPPLKRIISPDMFANLPVTHSRMMVFFSLQPALTMGLGAWFLPILVDAKDMAIPRLNSFALIFLIVGFCFNFATFSQPDAANLIWISLTCWGISALCYSINVIITLLNERSKSVRFVDWPVFVWAQGLCAVLMLPIASILLAMLTKAQWGKTENLALAIQQTTQILSYPMVLLLLIPAFGIIFHIIGTLTNTSIHLSRNISAVMVLASAVVFLMWDHTLFNNHLLNYFQSDLTNSFIPVGLFSLVAGLLIMCLRYLFQEKRVYYLPLWWVMGFIALLGIGWPVEGIVKGLNHIHSCVAYAALYAAFAGFYFWMGKISGCFYSEILGKLHFLVTSIGVLFFLNLLPIGIASSAIGSAFFGISIFIFVIILFQAWKSRSILPDNYWGEGAVTREWRLSSPISVRSL